MAIRLTMPMGTQSAQHITVAMEAGRFKGWPANSGLWRWGSELLVMYTDATSLVEDLSQHTYDRNQPTYVEQARSLDGGLTWKVEKGRIVKPGPPGRPYWGNNGPAPQPLTTPMDFSNPNFAFHLEFQHYEYGFSRFWYTTDRGKNWLGPFRFPEAGFATVAARPNYVINDAKNMMVVVSASTVSDQNEDSMRNVLMQTQDGGLSWQQVATVGRIPALKGKSTSNASIMGTLTRLSPNKLVSLNREWDRTAREEAWISAWESNDGGKTWQSLAHISTNNKSTPPSVTQLPSGRLVLTYGYRAAPYGIRARLSDNQGKTWSKEIILRSDGGNFDIGYTRDVLLDNGKLLTVYYYNTDPRADRFIGATIWEPSSIEPEIEPE
jgi:hypothetical protein